MPARPAYFHRLSDAIGELKRWKTPWVDRRAIEELVGVSKAGAWRLMRRCGAEEGPGHALVCRRDDLVAALEAIEQTGESRQEVGRRVRLEAYLDEMAVFAKSRQSRIASERKASELLSSRFSKLPAGVELTPRSLTIEFLGAEDFLQKMGSVIFALQNDFEAIREFIEGRR
jgi:hypothetical protein